MNRINRVLDGRSLDSCVELEVVFGLNPEDKENNPVIRVYAGNVYDVKRKIEEGPKLNTTGAYASIVITHEERAGCSIITVPYHTSVDEFVRYISLAEKEILKRNRFRTEDVHRTLRVTFKDDEKYVTQEDKLDGFRAHAKVSVGYE